VLLVAVKRKTGGGKRGDAFSVFSVLSSSSSCLLRASVSPHVLLAMPPLSFFCFFFLSRLLSFSFFFSSSSLFSLL